MTTHKPTRAMSDAENGAREYLVLRRDPDDPDVYRVIDTVWTTSAAGALRKAAGKFSDADLEAGVRLTPVSARTFRQGERTLSVRRELRLDT